MVSNIWSRIRGDLVAGVLILAPLGLTIWALFFLVNITDSLIVILPQRFQPEFLIGYSIPGLGIILSLFLLWLFGALARLYAGRKIIEGYEALLNKVPVISSVYTGLKQLFATVFSQKKENFSKAVILEYPRKGLYCLAFVTNEKSAIKDNSELLSVFLPTTPNPTSGFFLMVPREDVRFLDLSIEDAFKMIMSAGLVLPAPIAFRDLEQTQVREGAKSIMPNDNVIQERDIE